MMNIVIRLGTILGALLLLLGPFLLMLLYDAAAPGNRAALTITAGGAYIALIYWLLCDGE